MQLGTPRPEARIQCSPTVAFKSLLVILLLSISGFARAAELASAPSWEPPPRAISGPFVIESVYPAIELDSTYVDQCPMAEHGYNFWGNDLVASDMQLTVFDNPISYPYRFRQGGDALLADRLKTLEAVDADSVNAGDHPNIPEGRQYEFRGSGLEKLLVNERFVRFGLKKWPDLTVLKFPSFVVLQLVKRSVRAVEDYDSLSRHFQEITSDFAREQTLQEVLGIARTGDNAWNNASILVFVSSPYFKDIGFENRYVFGPDPWPTKTERFLREVSVQAPLREGKRPSDLMASVFGCHDILVERGDLGVWRYYYAMESIFFDSSKLGFLVAGPGAPHLELARILRAALFANVALPQLINSASKDRISIEDLVARAQMIRRDLFSETGARTIQTGYSELANTAAQLPELSRSVRRLNEALDGIKQLREYTAGMPGISPLQADMINRENSNAREKSSTQSPDPCLEMYNFNRRWNENNDRRKVDAYERQIDNLKTGMQRGLEALDKELSAGVELAESRRSGLESKRAAAVGILLPSGFTCLLIIAIGSRRKKRRSDGQQSHIQEIAPFLAPTLAGLFWLAYLYLW